MKTDNRMDEIANYVIGKGEVRIDELVARFNVSRMTIHRHIDRLAQQGVIRKLHGAVSAQPSGIYESLFRYRETVSTAEKAALAQAALAYVSGGEVVVLDDSSTVNALAPLLPEAAPLTVVTNSVPALATLRDVDGIDLICTGGQYHRTYNAYIGHNCLNTIARLRADVLICSASAVQGTTAFIQDQQVVSVKQAMMASASKRILLVDHTKFGKVALHVFDDLASFDVVLVDDRLPPTDVQRLRDAGVRLQVIKATRK
jgi:DeoR/GlpR family transcriptional regulator of sugar metabolism